MVFLLNERLGSVKLLQIITELAEVCLKWYWENWEGQGAGTLTVLHFIIIISKVKF